MPELSRPPIWLSYAMIGALLLALTQMPYGYYQFLRLIVTAYCAYVAAWHFQRKPGFFAWIYTAAAIKNNPIFIIAMERDTHAIFNIGTALLILLEMTEARESFLHPKKQ
ncbi:MAG: hypothetical protein CL949_07195 [Erythrobacter sp.]|nr:hypothetical protein [Erythrobacter sp.]|tara:strand:+ start:262 stop:591 length:330 start_codon:yes stop_codon:yes gene_type:complete